MDSGARLSRLMVERGVTPTELARKTGLSLSTIYRLLHNEADGGLSTWHRIAVVLGVDVAYFTR